MQLDNTFRDRPENIDEKGKRKKLRVKQPNGVWYTRRTFVSIILLVFFILAPIITIDGNPFMLLDVVNREFFLFSIPVYSQDTDIMAIVMAITVVSILLFTVLFGRIWCGWLCPHTIFMEMVFRRIEYLFEGNYRKPSAGIKKLPKTLRSSLLHFTYIVVILFFTNFFIMWFVGLPKLLDIWASPFIDYWQVYTAMILVSLFYYWIYSYIRESVCTLFCPYGRMQGVLLDAKSISVMYDYTRGDPRGINKKGDCIDCGQCISVCPTGIDIKNGTQLECVNCTACIDECNQVMAKIGKAKNLIKYASPYSIETGKNSLKNSRFIAYSLVLLVLISVLIASITRRSSTESTLLRIPGTMYQKVNNDTISNIYRLKIINKSPEDKSLSIKLISPKEGKLILTEKSISIHQNSNFEHVVIIKIPKNIIKEKSVKIEAALYDNSNIIELIKTNFIAP